MTPSALSMVLSGKRNLSFTSAERIADSLGLNPQVKQAFVNGAKQGLGIAFQLSTGHDFELRSLDEFEYISEWYHLAIYSLVETKTFRSSPAWIARRLGISLVAAKTAIARLERLKIIDTSKKNWSLAGKPPAFENKISTGATRKYQKQILEKATSSLENDPMSIRDMSSMTLAIDPKLIPIAIEEIRKFRRNLVNYLEGKGNRTEVYHLAVQIYPVTKENKD